MENLNLADLKLSQEESGDIIEFLTRKRNIKNYKRNRAMNYCNLYKKRKLTNNSLKIRKE